MKIAVYTAIFGDYNPLRIIPKQSMVADYICFTDNEKLIAQGWKTIFTDYPRKDLHPRMRAKYFKVLPHYINELNDYDIVIWIDGSIEIKDKDFIKYCIDGLDNNDMVLFKHPQRDCIFEEFIASDECRKYDHEDKIAQRIDYRMRYPEHGGLYACGVSARRHKSKKIIKVMNDWWHEIIKYTIQDQVSFPVVCLENNYIPNTFSDNQYSNKYFNVCWHDDVRYEKKVSVLMPVYNTNVTYFKEAFDSIIKQTYKNYEIIIVDDGSTDKDTLKYLEEIASTPNTKIIKLEKNLGLSIALNKGIEACETNLIARMDSDDTANTNWLTNMVLFMDKNPGVQVCGCQIKCFGIYNFKTNHPAIVDKKYALNKNINWIANHPGIIYRKDFIQSIGAYGDVPKHLAIEDWYLWCKVIASGHHIYNLPYVLVNYRVDKQREDTAERKKFREQCRDMINVKYADKVTYHMATIPSRINCLKDTVFSILPQCDELHIYLNDFKIIPEFLNDEKIKLYKSKEHLNDIGDVGKFYNCENWSGYNFTVDDKIIYPSDYTEKTIKKIEFYNRKSIVCYHGRIMHHDRASNSYYKDFRFVVDYLNNNTKDTNIHIPGSGVMAFHSEFIKFQIDIFTRINMSDIFMGIFAQKNNINIIALQHASSFFKLSKNLDNRYRICNTFANDDKVQTDIVNSIKWKKL